MDVNEEIVKAWLQLCKNQFTMEGIQFKVYGEEGGSNYADIDILAVDTKGKYYDYEVKWRSAYSLSSKDKEDAIWYRGKLVKKQRIDKVRSIIGKKHYEKVFITTHKLMGKTDAKRKKLEAFFRKKDLSILYFEDIIPQLLEKVLVTGRYDSPILQTIRMLKYFGHIKTD